MQYVTNQATRIIVRAVGELGQDGKVISSAGNIQDEQYDTEDQPEIEPVIHKPTPHNHIDYLTYRPNIQGNVWQLSETDLCRHFLS